MALTKNTGLFFYDGKRIWEYYMSLGRAATYKRVRQWCADVGMVNPQNGKVSMMGPRFAMWRYAIRNPDEAFVAYQEWQREYGNYPTFNEFCQDCVNHAYTKKTCIVSPREKQEFVEKYINGN